MFKKVTESVVKNCGAQTLHGVTDLNAAERFKPLCVVQKKTSFWPFKKPVMIPTYVKITDLLRETVDISVSNREFTLLKQFNENPTLHVSGSISAKVAEELNLELKGDETCKLVIKLGDMEKNEASWQSLHKLMENNLFNCNDEVYKDAKYSGMSLCVVIESISTKGEGSVEEGKSQSGSAAADADVKKLVKCAIVPEVHTKGSIERKEDNSFIIPPSTVLAYSCVEFTVDHNGSASLHAMSDRLDEEPGQLLADNDYDDGDEYLAPKVAIAKIKAEFEPWIHTERFAELQGKAKLLLAEASTEDFRVMSTLLQIALVRFADESDDKSISIAFLNDIFGRKIAAPWAAVMTHLGFTIPTDISDVDACILFPAEDNSDKLNACVGLVDSVMDVSSTARKHLSKVSTDHIKELLKMVMEQLEKHNVNTKDSAVQSLIHDDTAALSFLTYCGFLKLPGEKKFVYTDNPLKLLDIYAVLYMLSL